MPARMRVFVTVVLQFLQKHRSQLRDAARAQRQHHVAWLCKRGNRSNSVWKRWSVSDAPRPCSCNATRERFRRDAFDRLLASRINIKQAKRVGVGEGGSELIHQIASAGEPVRLKDHMHPPESALASGGQRGPYFRRMVAVIVNHADARDRTFELEAPINSTKFVKRGTNLLRGNVEHGTHRNSRRRIQHVVRARNVQRELSEIFLLISHLEADQLNSPYKTLR